MRAARPIPGATGFGPAATTVVFVRLVVVVGREIVPTLVLRRVSFSLDFCTASPSLLTLHA